MLSLPVHIPHQETVVLLTNVMGFSLPRSRDHILCDPLPHFVFKDSLKVITGKKVIRETRSLGNELPVLLAWCLQ